MSKNFVANPYADRFPMLGEEELERLAQDIAENGLNNPIVIDSDGRVLDGRNRFVACRMAGVSPDLVEFDGDDEAMFVLSANVARRHLSTGQQAMSTALVLVDAGKRENGRWVHKSVDMSAGGHISGWRQRLHECGLIIDLVPELIKSVVSGETLLTEAYRKAEQKRDAERQLLEEEERYKAEEEAFREHLEQVAPKYLEQYPNARVAFSAWETDNARDAAEKRQREREAKQKAKDEWESSVDLYMQITTAGRGLATYSEHDIGELFGRYEQGMLTPNMERHFTKETFLKAAQVAARIADWIE